MSRSYFTPYKLSSLQRAFLIPYFGIGSFLDPVRGDLVAGLADATGNPYFLLYIPYVMTVMKYRRTCPPKTENYDAANS
jgi:hypothetical protein